MKKLRPRERILFAPRTHGKLKGELALLDFSIQDPFTWTSDWEASFPVGSSSFHYRGPAELDLHTRHSSGRGHAIAAGVNSCPHTLHEDHTVQA